MQNTTVSMGCVFTEAYIGGNVYGGEDITNKLNCLNDGAFRIVCRRTLPILL